MKTVQMTLDEQLVAEVDTAARKQRTSRSAFTREALRAALKRLREQEGEKRHKEGYARKPVRRGEFDSWHSQQAWPE